MMVLDIKRRRRDILKENLNYVRAHRIEIMSNVITY